MKLAQEAIPKKRGWKPKVAVAVMQDSEETSDSQPLSQSDDDLETLLDLEKKEEFESDLQFGINDFTIVKTEMEEKIGLKHCVDCESYIIKFLKRSTSINSYD